MKFENTQVWGFEHAFRGMRNAKNSWDKSDSFFGLVDSFDETDYDIAAYWAEAEKPEYYGENFGEYEDERIKLENKYDEWLLSSGILRRNPNYDIFDVAFIGPNDMELAQKLIRAGSEHRKFLRQIFVSVDITAPLYWFKEFDTYKVGTVANSTSTMHTIEKSPITIENFEIDDYKDYCSFLPDFIGEEGLTADDCESMIMRFIDFLEGLRVKYLETKDKKYWKELIRWLPESWLQTRTVTFNYENLFGMCSKGQRRFHKLNEWSGIDNPALENFIAWARTLPYAQELIFADELWENEEKLKREKIKAFDVLINALKKNDYDVDNMSTDEVLDEIIDALNL